MTKLTPSDAAGDDGHVRVGVGSFAVRSAPTGSEGRTLTIHIERETDTERIERCDHEGTTEPLAGLASVSVCTACGKTWPTRFGAGAPTVRIASTASEG